MARIFRLVFVSLTICSAAIAASTPLNIRAGGWDITTTITTSGNPIPAGVLAKMPPAQRARLEASLKARAAKPHTMASKTCITAKDLKDSFRTPMGHDDDEERNCKTTVVSATGSLWQATIACTGEEARTGTMKVTELSPTQMTSVVEMATGASKSKMVQTGQWKSASCAGYDR